MKMCTEYVRIFYDYLFQGNFRSHNLEDIIFIEMF